MKVMIATPGVSTHYLYVQSLLSQCFVAPDRLTQLEKYDLALFQIGGQSGLSKDRGIIASYAVHGNFDKLMFIDSDQSWKWEDLKKLLDSDKKIISGVVALKQYPQVLNFTQLERDKDAFEDEDQVVSPKGLKRLRQKYHGQDEIEVAAAGFGFQCIDVSVFRERIKDNVACPAFAFKDAHTNKIIPVWDFFATGVVGKIYLGEDWSSSVQARRIGIPTYINSTVLLPHHGGHSYEVGHEVVRSEGYDVAPRNT